MTINIFYIWLEWYNEDDIFENDGYTYKVVDIILSHPLGCVVKAEIINSLN